MYLGWWSSPIWPNSNTLNENPLAGQSGWKNYVSKAQILIIFTIDIDRGLNIFET
jgi:hypothetical protein